MSLDPVERVEDDHPLLDRDVVRVEPALLARTAAEDPQMCVWHRSRPRQWSPGPSRAAQLVGHRWEGRSPDRHRPVGVPGDHAVEAVPARLVGRRVVEPAVGAAALGPLAGAAGDRLGHDQQVVQLEDEVPAGIEDPTAGHLDGGEAADAGRPARRGPASRSASSRKMPTRRCIISWRSRWMA